MRLELKIKRDGRYPENGEDCEDGVVMAAGQTAGRVAAVGCVCVRGDSW